MPWHTTNITIYIFNMKNYLHKALSVALLFVSALGLKAQTVERMLYYTDFTEWAATTATSVEITTRFAADKVTFTTAGDMVVAPETTVNSRKGYIGLPTANKNGTVETSVIPSVTTLEFEETVARGGGNGLKLEVMGDGDAGWVALVTEKISKTTTKVVDVNRKNVKLRWSNISTGKAVYLTAVKICGSVASDKVPQLASFRFNGAGYDATNVFAEQNDGAMTGTMDISKTVNMLGEANPFEEVKASVGTVKSITYNGDAVKCDAEIVVTNNVDEVTYKLTVVQKPDYTVTYSLLDGTVLATQTVEKDAPIVAFPSNIQLPGNGVFRGYHAEEIHRTGENQKFEAYRKITVDEIITKDIKFYAIETPEEVATDSRHEYRLNDHINGKLNPYFYMEDHEGISVVSGEAAFHDAQHGWKFGANSQLKLQHDGNAQIALYLCSATNPSATISVQTEKGSSLSFSKATDADNRVTALAVNDGSSYSVLTFSEDCYLHAISVTNRMDRVKTDNGYMQVAAGDADAYLATLEKVNSDGGNARIFLPDGTYYLGERVLTELTADNVSIIGESMLGTVIVNEPKTTKEGIALTATLLNKSNGLYMQDLTLQNALDYYGNKGTSGGGRAICLQDKGTNTICKNVRMLSYQDTYYSNNTGNFYFEDSEIHGTVDYLCGDGNVVYNRVKLVNENRTASDAPNGSCTISAPNCKASTSARKNWGYVFFDCTVDCKSATFNLGRSWGGESKLAYINTTILQPERLDAMRFSAGGMNVAAFGFYEYGTKNAAGELICPESKIINFTHSTGNRQYETILGAPNCPGGVVTDYTIANIFGSWNPDQTASQKTISAEEDIKAELSETYLVNADGTAIIVPASDVQYYKTGFTTVSVRASNGRGGFGNPFYLVGTPTAIDAITSGVAETPADAVYYNLSGQRVTSAERGIVIVNGKKIVK